MLKTRPNQMTPNRSMNTNGSTRATSAISAPSVFLSIGFMCFIRLVRTVGHSTFYCLLRDQPHRHRRRAIAKNNWRSCGIRSGTGQVDDGGVDITVSRSVIQRLETIRIQEQLDEPYDLKVGARWVERAGVKYRHRD